MQLYCTITCRFELYILHLHFSTDSGRIARNDETYIVTPDKLLCRIGWGANVSPDEEKPNANLIAAAPDMYEACRKLVDWDNSHDDAQLISEACSYARQALSKAEGK